MEIDKLTETSSGDTHWVYREGSVKYCIAFLKRWVDDHNERKLMDIIFASPWSDADCNVTIYYKD